MIKKAKHIITAFLIAMPLWLLADGKTPPSQSSKSNNFSKKEFSKNSNFSKNGTVLTPPPTGGAGQGHAAPINGGFLLLVAGSVIFLTKKISDDVKNNHPS